MTVSLRSGLATIRLKCEGDSGPPAADTGDVVSCALDRCRLSDRLRRWSEVSKVQSTMIPAGVDGPEVAVPDMLRGNVRDRDALRLPHAASDDLVRCDGRLALSACWSLEGKSRFIIWLNFFLSVPINPCNLFGEDGGDTGPLSAPESDVDVQ